MSDESEHVWDEHQWERFLQQQEKRTERYMELLDKYLDHPQRDEIIAKEMEWTHQPGDEDKDWEEEVDARFEEELAGIEASFDEDESAPFPLEQHPLYRMAIEFNAEISRIVDGLSPAAQEHPVCSTMHTSATVSAAKIAAALSDGDCIQDFGMSIAYLKRALHSIHGVLSAAAQMETSELLTPEEAAAVRNAVFTVRDGLVCKIGECRAEFRKRYGR